MADITALEEAMAFGNRYSWGDVTENDTPLTKIVDGGDYSMSVEGDFAGSLSIEMKFGKDAGNEHTIEGGSSNVFTENRTVNIKTGQGFILPIVTGGTASSVNITLTRIPS